MLHKITIIIQYIACNLALRFIETVNMVPSIGLRSMYNLTLKCGETVYFYIEKKN